MKLVNLKMQYAISILLVVLASILCFAASPWIGYKVVAFILLVVVSLLAMLFDIIPVLMSALLSALIWNYFFIPPKYTFHINRGEDLLMFLMYFVIASVNAVLTFKIREQTKKARDKEEKEHTIKLYDTLFNSLSHELKTPLSTIMAVTDTLKENADKLTDENKAELLQALDIATARLHRQVGNLLNMSRLESGMLQLHRDWCDINELLFSVIRQFSNLQQQRILYKPQEELPFFYIDEGIIEQVLHNLIHNAILYTPNTGCIKIFVSYKDDVCLIRISDTGKGFPDETIPYAFDKFYRLPDSVSGGTGLGLSIVKGFVEVHGGQVLLENNKAGGADFFVTLPARTSFINKLRNE